MFCFYTSSKLLFPYFEFSLKVKVVGLNADYFLKGDSLMAASSFLIYALKLLLLANATLKQNAKIRGLDGIRHTGHGNWSKFPNFAPK